MTEKRFLLKYSEYETSNGEIIEVLDPYFIDTQEEYVDDDYFTIDGCPTMSDEQVLNLLNENEQLKEDLKKKFVPFARADENGITKVDTDEFIKILQENEQLKQQINNIRLDWNQDYREFNKDTLYIEDHNTKIKLKDGRLYIEVFIPKINEYFRFNYIVTGRKLEREYNTIKGDSNDSKTI